MTTGGSHIQRAAVGYAVAVAGAALAGLFRWMLDPVLHDTSQYVVFYPAVLLASVIGGRGPGILALGLGSGIGVWFFVQPQGLSIGHPDDLVRLVLFVFIGISIVLLTGWLRDARQLAAAEAEHANEANRAKDRLLAMVSHELRSPLVPIMTTASLLRNDPALPNAFRDDLEMIERNARLEARLIDDLLDLTRAAHGKLHAELQPTDACEALRQALATCQPNAEAKGVELSLDRRCTHSVVNADSTRLQQVFWNLIRNAVKFTPAGGTVKVDCQDSGDQRLVVSVSDTGAGIAPADLSRIFLPFEQTEAGCRAGGLGLGLAITKALVDLHGGTIRAESEGRGKGATFQVELPLLSTTKSPGPIRAGTYPPKIHGERPALARPLRILLVEDHADTARTMCRLLTADGHKVRTAANVAQALEASESQDLDLIISDLGLPDGSGLELMRTLRSQGNDVPSIAMSGYSEKEHVRRSKEAGFTAHLGKPASPKQLEEAISAVTRDGTAGAADRTPGE